jgi:hypothetical protein
MLFSDMKYERLVGMLRPDEREKLDAMLELGLGKHESLLAVIQHVNQKTVEALLAAIEVSIVLSPPDKLFAKKLIGVLMGYLRETESFLRDANLVELLSNLHRYVDESKPYWFWGVDEPEHIRLIASQICSELLPDVA